jgi:hypothetical protein
MAIEINISTPSSPVPTVNGISVIWAGVWTSSKVYRRNEGVFHSGSSYRANKTTTQTPSNLATDWDLIAQGGEGGSGTITDHIANTSNPHSTTAAQVGAIPTSEKGIASGVATLDSGGKIPDTQIPNAITRDSELTNYYIKTETDTLLNAKANQTTTYTKTETDTLLTAKANQSTTYTKTETDTLLNAKPNNLIQLGDVVITAPIDGQALVYDSSTTKWVNETISHSGGGGGGGGGNGEINTASNVGTAGVGIFKQKTEFNLEFKKVNAGSNKISITDDTTNSEVDIDVNEANLTLGNLAGIVPVSKGGTGSTNATNALTALGAASNSNLTSHTGNTSNPHSTTAAQVGAIPTSEKGIASGVSTLDSGGKIPDVQIASSIARLTNVTAAQVGNTTAQWNADKIQGVNVHTTTPTNGQVLTYSTANSRYEPATPASGGKVIQVIYASAPFWTISTNTPNQSITLAASITPTNASSTIYITGALTGVTKTTTAASHYFNVQVFDGTTAYGIANNVGRRADIYPEPVPIILFLPASNTSTRTYTIRCTQFGGGIISSNSTSYLTLMEIAP